MLETNIFNFFKLYLSNWALCIVVVMV